MGSPESRFSAQVERCFSRGASAYPRSATLQAAVATRLAQLARPLATALPSGPRADLGAGSGLLSRALETSSPISPCSGSMPARRYWSRSSRRSEAFSVCGI